MKPMMKKTLAIGAALAAMAVAIPHAGGQGPGYGWGPGGGYGPGMMGGYGPGMMGGYGQGMMGGYGRGFGGGPIAALNLTDEQQEKIFAIQEESRKKNWDTMS